MANTIYASFADAALAEKAAGALLDHGVRAEDISVVNSRTGTDQLENVPDRDYTNRQLDDTVATTAVSGTYVTTSAATTWPGNDTNPDAARLTYAGSVFGTDYVAPETDLDKGPDPERSAKEGISTTTAADAGAGAVKGAEWGIGVGVIAGIASLIIPGVGLVLGGGALATALAGVVATTGAGAAAGAVTGYLKDQGMDDQAAENYDRAIKNGGAIIAVTVPSGNVDEFAVQQVLDKYGAANVNRYATRGYVS